MNIYTLVQCIGLAVLWVVKSSPVALFFPFFIVAMIPLRFALKFIFSLSELEAVSISKLFTTLTFPVSKFYSKLDGKSAGRKVTEETQKVQLPTSQDNH